MKPVRGPRCTFVGIVDADCESRQPRKAEKEGGTYDINRVGFVCKNQIFKGRGDDGEAISVLKQTRKLTVFLQYMRTRLEGFIHGMYNGEFYVTWAWVLSYSLLKRVARRIWKGGCPNITNYTNVPLYL